MWLQYNREELDQKAWAKLCYEYLSNMGSRPLRSERYVANYPSRFQAAATGPYRAIPGCFPECVSPRCFFNCSRIPDNVAIFTFHPEERTKKTQRVDCKSAAGAKPLRVILPQTLFFLLRNASKMPWNLQSALI